MPPLVEAFHASALTSHVNKHPNGKARKPNVKLSDCELKELLQYNCDLENAKDMNSKVICEPVLRLFRQCANGLTVETTSWEDRYDDVK